MPVSMKLRKRRKNIINLYVITKDYIKFKLNKNILYIRFKMNYLFFLFQTPHPINSLRGSDFVEAGNQYFLLK